VLYNFILKVVLCNMGDLDLHCHSSQHKLTCGKLPLKQNPNVVPVSLSETFALTLRIYGYGDIGYTYRIYDLQYLTEWIITR